MPKGIPQPLRTKHEWRTEPNRCKALEDPEILYGFLAAVYGDSKMMSQFKHLKRIVQGRGSGRKRYNEKLDECDYF